MRTTWAAVALGLGLLCGGTPAHGETVVGEYLPVVRTAENPASAAPAAPLPKDASPPVLASPPSASPPAHPVPSNNATISTPPPSYSHPVLSSGPSGYGCSSCQSGWGDGKDPCFCGYPCVWGSVEYIQLWFKDGPIPPLVTAGPGPNRPTLDRPDTTVISGGSVTDPSHPGMRALIGFGFPSDHPCDPCCHGGVELSGFFVAQKGDDFRAGSLGLPVIGRPFLDVTTGVPVQAAADVARVGAAVGTVEVISQCSMGGIEGNGVGLLWCDATQGYRLELLVGVRALSLSEEVSINQFLESATGSGERLFVRDNFTTRNRFYGGQIGLRGERAFGGFFVQGTAKLALGVTRERVYINGFTLDQFPGFDQVHAEGGLLALRTNMGRHYHNEFSVVPEAQVKVGYQVNSMVRLTAGYTFLLVSNVLRPGDQIDLAVNTRRVPAFGPGVRIPEAPGGPDRPAFQFNQNSFWAQGVTGGVELRY